MNSHSLITIDMTYDDYEELRSLLSACADVLDDNELSDDFRFFYDLLEANRR